MASFNYGMNCGTRKMAEKLFLHIEKMNISQDGLDLSEERVSVISNQALAEEIRKYSTTVTGEVLMEVWPEGMEYDEAEAKGKLEVYELKGKKPKTSAADTSPAHYRAYAGNEVNLGKFRDWLVDQKLQGFGIVEEWVPQVEHGTFGLQFTCLDRQYDKVMKAQWPSQGVITEKVRK